MEGNQMCILAAQLRGSANNKSNILTLSTRTLDTILSSFELLEEQSTSFHVKQPHNFKAELLRDLQYLSNYIQETKTLKLYIDSYDDTPEIDITKFRKLISLELSKVDVNTVKGLQLLRSQLQKLSCHKTQNNLSDILINCGGDKSRALCWNELKEAACTGNNIVELDLSLECAPWLHTLDLSHNEITNFEALSCLVNLKYLNLSYNRLEGVSVLRGQVCNRLQNLILKNNFIEDIAGLRALTNLWVLDLSNNCLVDHKSLIALSHLAALQWLNLQSNPLSFHPNHRNRTASYLHVNTATTHFVLNSAVLSKNEKKLVGSYYPLQMRTNSFSTDSLSLTTEKARRVRHVVIEEENTVRESSIPSLPPTPKQYLETKKQIEDLHEKFGESWLNSQSGLLDVLGLESFSLPLSTSPYEADFTIYSGDFTQEQEIAKGTVVEPPDQINEEYEKKIEAIPDEPDIEGEESIYLATVRTETEPIFIVIGQTHLSERECSTGNEREKWHLDSITNCEILDEGLTTVQIDFETMRKSRKQRIYVFEDEIEAFVACIKNKINTRQPKKEDDVKYQCMKCSTVFGRVKNESILGEAAVKCPSCDSTLVVEEV
ncbi:serine/threonine-protein kinase 11-interacting protein [Tribolium castaneum]|uniref:Serine/threonine-protein kinase 11-interacting protein-like Protein n=1 Tax=Tribolium castaneum TaxID=7070 RepID=D6X430_TRICA|nr:PREDICTED: serine/threonine-protein kinase 11-interacting protein [Tribolium castaneum]EEZ97501.1 Serine/threonine-protein kinase 11-interacting protein-like Protein [Tribolium castaneum]|eukprot:XP_971198.2 PREDICTED: serine/threonine-protein kinase 11-interacting protein [Tribolium castaneum]